MTLVFWRPQDWLLPVLYGMPILDIVFGIALLAFLLERDQGRIRVPTELPQVALLVGLFFACMMSHVANTYFQGIVSTAPEVFKICFFTMVLLATLDSPGKLRTVALMFVIMTGVMAVHAILQETRGYGFVGTRPIYIPPLFGKPAYTRSYFFGIFEDPNDLAQIFAASIPFAFALPRKRSFLGIVFGVAVSVLLVRAILATHSRGGQIGLLVTGVVMTVLILPSRWLPFLMGCLVVGGLVMCPFSAGLLDMSAYERVVFWGLANQAFKANMLFGLGYDMFWQVASSRAAHNAFVACYTEIGIFGYFFWFSLFLLGGIGVWRSRLALEHAETDDERWLRRFSGLAMASMMGFAASAYFLSRTFVYPLFFLFAILGALPVVTEKVLGEEKWDGSLRFDWRRDVVMWCGIGSIVSIIYIYISIVLLNAAVA